MNTSITPFGELKLRRTLTDRTPKEVQAHTQPPVGWVICPHCHGETNIDAPAIFDTIGNPHPLQERLQHSNYPVTVPNQCTLCIKCNGVLTVSKKDDNLLIVPSDVGNNIRQAEAILDEKNKQRQFHLRPSDPI